jgi:hypothetical protein
MIIIYSDDEREFISADYRTGNQLDMKYTRNVYNAKQFNSVFDASKWADENLMESVTFLQIKGE